jgi:hypothetical protein
MVFVFRSQLVTAVREELAQNPAHYALSIVTDGEETFWSHFERLCKLFASSTPHFEPHVRGAVILTCMVRRCRVLRRRADMTNLEMSVTHAGPWAFRLWLGCGPDTSVSIDAEDNVCVDVLGTESEE